MANQAHNIPWSLLTSNLEWKAPGPYNNFATNLYPRMKPNQAKDLTHFINAFVKNLDEHSICERKKYPEHYDPPQPSDVILDDAIVRKIMPTVRRWRQAWGVSRRCPSGACRFHTTWDMDTRTWLPAETCHCEPIPQEERLMSAFLRQRITNDCYEFHVNNNAFFNLEIVKTLLLYGEMDTILRICAHPDVCLKEWYRRAECWDVGGSLGWDQICLQMVTTYICLNVAYCFPETWDIASGRTAEKDYRNAKFYQKTLITCAKESQSLTVVGNYPHIQFFGMESCKLGLAMNTGKGNHWLLDENFHVMKRKNRKPTHRYYGCKDGQAPLFGRVPVQEFLSLWLRDGWTYEPSLSDTDCVRTILCSKGLPVEIALDIMKFADYKPPKSKLNTPHDPLHPSNREELGEYLKYCWQTMVRCYTMAIELGMDPVTRGDAFDGMNWKNIVSDAIISLFSHHKDQGYYYWLDLEFPDKSSRPVWHEKRTLEDPEVNEGYNGPFTFFV